MICDVCLEENEQSIDFISDEGIHLNVAEIVYRHLSFCFEIEPKTGAVCQKCWVKIQLWNSFYARAKEIHSKEIHSNCEDDVFTFDVVNVAKIEAESESCEIKTDTENGDEELSESVHEHVSSDDDDERMDEPSGYDDPPDEFSDSKESVNLDDFKDPKKKSKCSFNVNLQERYPFIEKTVSSQHVRCKVCGGKFNVAKNGSWEIERHLKTQKHIKNSASSSHTAVNQPQSREDAEDLPIKKSRFIDTLKTKYPFIQTTISDRDMRCNQCHAEFNIGKNGSWAIERHVRTTKHQRSMNDSTYVPKLKLDSNSQKRVHQKRLPSNKKSTKNTLIRDAFIPDSDVYRCEECNISFLTKVRLYRHLKESHMKLPFECPEKFCVESFETEETLNVHVKEFHERTECPICKSSVQSDYLKDHIKLLHDESQRVICDLCGKVSKNMRIHKEHTDRLHGDGKLQCDICKIWLANKYSIRKHMTLKHLNTPQKCSLCGKIYANKNSLHRHMKLHEDNERVDKGFRIKCLLCNKRFRYKFNMQKHMAIHGSNVDRVYT